MTQQLLKTIADLEERVDCLPDSDEVQAILRGILVVIKLEIEAHPSSIPLQTAFYSHLDNCPRCSERPFDLCSEGQVLIRAAAFEAAHCLRKQREERTA